MDDQQNDKQTISAGKVIPVYVEDEMQKCYIDYAMSVIVQRALPDVRDGLKPVHRRILYAMNEAGMLPNKAYKKSARIVGDVLGKYHPHGDSSVYDAIVRLAQDFSTRYLMVDGHGNFGSVDGDPAAAMRYTEVRMGKIAVEMLRDIEKDTVDFIPNYDESLKEPTVLPAKVPALLINGSAGIAVGMATNIPPHNLGEVVDACVMLIDHPDATVEQLMTAVKGPDFPTGAKILGLSGIRQAYTTGRGVVKVRAKTHVEPMPKNKNRIVVTEIPYQVNKAKLIENIAHLVQDKTLEGITDLRDESDRKGMRIVIELRSDVVPEIMLNKLYKHTQLQDSFGIIMLALVNGHPRILNLKQILEYYLDHQKDVITRKCRYELKKAKERAHILEGLKIALDHLDEVIATIRASANGEVAKAALMEKFGLSDRQAQAILDMRLQRLTGLERQKIEDEYKEVMATIAYLEDVLSDEHKIMGIAREDLLDVKKRFGDARRTSIVPDTGDLETEDLIAEEDVVITISHQSYIKRQALTNFRNQNRGGRGIKAGSGKIVKEDNKVKGDFSEHLLMASTHDNILFFTNRGRVYRQKGFEIPEASRTAKGTFIRNLLPLEENEKVNAVIAVKSGISEDEKKFLFMATNLGYVKRTSVSEFKSARKGGLIAINLGEGEELIDVKLTSGHNDILLATRDGYAIHFLEDDVRPMGRTSHGVRGISLRPHDSVVSMDSCVDDTGEVLTVTDKGQGKRTDISEYRVQTRGGKGIINLKVTDRTGLIVGSKFINETHDIMLISAAGIIIRMNAADISTYGRNAQGVKLMDLEAGDKVAALAIVNTVSEDE
ncbi:DNA gyrase subunit A [Acidaminococcus fermentans]|uniref:DNA gyrase subunit A n=5 Tax=Acidaminococcus fermentans TaxID=905 RepID=D2RMU1_ACIFV|nr:DNA gyrase subunit A [Acidaminococcus fermentans]ADB46421.1 DNA gyrase, A subunit [Acidaminococcus fermentans DSM 20731]MCF0139892.1 DNA gyrase subunit A [Acidaminococcus fermentans]MDD6288464.1 DNA gyrase subunit A [Acidaminococcus fermentans]MDD7195682.1 DNA gyrase subunit A [Acidaminococcus fermentans]MDY2852406.1 DNA gyrase subunit A [Acidaminococcus fermentans]